MVKSLWLAVVAALLGMTSPAVAYPAPYTCTRNFYVATTGSDAGGCGSVGSPCASLQGANDNIALTGGDCVNVGPGTYNMVGAILNRGGNANTTIVYVPY